MTVSEPDDSVGQTLGAVAQMPLVTEASQPRRVVVGVVALSLGGEALAFGNVVLPAGMQPVVAPHAQPQQGSPVMHTPGSLLEVVDV